MAKAMTAASTAKDAVNRAKAYSDRRTCRISRSMQTPPRSEAHAGGQPASVGTPRSASGGYQARRSPSGDRERAADRRRRALSACHGGELRLKGFDLGRQLDRWE